jgi:hypothetical protein
VQHLSKANDQLDFDEVTKTTKETMIYFLKKKQFTFVIKSRRSDDVVDGNVNSIDRIIRIVSC